MTLHNPIDAAIRWFSRKDIASSHKHHSKALIAEIKRLVNKQEDHAKLLFDVSKMKEDASLISDELSRLRVSWGQDVEKLVQANKQIDDLRRQLGDAQWSRDANRDIAHETLRSLAAANKLLEEMRRIQNQAGKVVEVCMP